MVDNQHSDSRNYMENIPIDELKVGLSASTSRVVTANDVRAFAALSGDVNPLHLDEEYAKTTEFGECIAHGTFCAMLVTTAVGTQLPGPGTIYRSQEYKFLKPARLGDTITVTVTIEEIKVRSRLIVIDNEVVNQHGDVLLKGRSKAIAPAEKLRVPKPNLSLDNALA